MRLAPLYDFAPMMVDPEWIGRACRWQEHETAGYPHWHEVARSMATTPEENKTLRHEARRLQALLSKVPQWLRGGGVDKRIVERCVERCRHVREDLADATEG